MLSAVSDTRPPALLLSILTCRPCVFLSAPGRRGHITTQPAYIYVPRGTYRIQKPISLLVGTFLVGDALNLPTLVAHPDLASTGSGSGSGPVVIYAHDNHFKTNAASQNFYITVRNLIIDTTGLDPEVQIAGLDWSVSQGCSLGNVHFVMASETGGQNRHTGITMSQFGSGIEVADCVSSIFIPLLTCLTRGQLTAGRHSKVVE